jgi:hypothetical protein
MGRVVSFSEFENYYSAVRTRPDIVGGAILDTNILISLTYEVKPNHEEVFGFFDQVLIRERERGFRFFTTVNTRSEFLEFNRRLIMTEKLRDAADENSRLRIPQRAKAQIHYQSGQLKRREQLGGDPVFNDTQVKAIKSAFSAGRFSGQMGWLSLCEEFLAGKLEIAEQGLADFGVEYISQHDTESADLFERRIDWSEARAIAEKSCLGLSDAMILNALQCSKLPFVVSTDFDIGYAAMASQQMKDVVMPDSVATKYRGYHFDSVKIAD